MAKFKVTSQDQHGNDVEESVTAENMHIDDGSLVFFVKGSDVYGQDLVQAYAPGHWTSAVRVI